MEEQMYHRSHVMNVSSFDPLDKVGYVNKNKTRNCTLDAIQKYDAKFSKLVIRLDPELKADFQRSCENEHVSMNEKITSLITEYVEAF